MNWNVIKDLETPALLIDLQKVRHNIEDMQALMNKNHCDLRPHIKTHKLPRIARMQMEAGAVGVTCAKTTEALVMAENGVSNIFVAYSVVGEQKLERLARINGMCELIVAVDSIAAAQALSEKGVSSGKRFKVRAEMAVGFRRTGVPMEQMVDFVKAVSAMEGLEFVGVFAYHAATIGGVWVSDLEAATAEEIQMLRELTQMLRAAGIECRDVSGGSTPTGKLVTYSDVVTESRPGTYVFYDMMNVKQGVATQDQCALQMLVTVISKGEDYVVVDGGSKTFATDVQPNQPPYYLEGFGVVVGHEDLRLARMTEEHGMISSIHGGPVDLEIGDKVLIIPSHACCTLNLHDRAWLVDGDEIICERIAARGCVQ